MKNMFYKKWWFWVVIILIILALPSAFKAIQLYVYDPSPEPRPEDFYVRRDELFTGLTPAPKEEVEISKTADGKIFVDAKKDGYTLTLDPELGVYTRELEKGLVYISDKNGCRVSVTKAKGENVMDQFEENKKEYESDPWSEVELYEINKLDYQPQEAYLITYKHKVFEVQNKIHIQGNDGFISLGQNMSYSKCDLLMKVLEGFNFKDV